MRHIFISIGILLALGACSADKQEVFFDGGAQITVRTGKHDQTAISVLSEADKADAKLVKWQGYAHARDRFLQMDLIRRMSRGKLGELFGPEAHDSETRFISDTTVWSLGLVDASKRSLAKIEQDHEVMELLLAYADGVNEYLKELEKDDPELLKRYRKWTHNPNYRPDPWEPIDSISVATQLSFLLSNSLSKKAMVGSMYFALVDPDAFVIDPKKVKKLIDLRPLENISILPPREDLEEVDSRFDPRRLLDFFGKGVPPFAFVCDRKAQALIGGCGGFDIPGSNNWVVSKEYAGGNQAFLLNDPHLMYTFPTSFTEMALDSKSSGGSYRVRGLVPPGVPGILIGHNDAIAWGFTNSMSDVDDLYAESFHSKDPNKVRFNGKFIEIENRQHTFYVRNREGGLDPVTKTLRVVPGHGPIVTDHVSQFKRIKKGLKGLEFSYKWTGHKGSTEVPAVLELNRAKNFDEFKTALKNFEVGAQNVIYADGKNIGYYSHGHFPMRPYLTKLGAAPPYVPNMSYGKDEWAGFREKVPELYNPDKGFIATANNDVYGYNQKPKLNKYHDYFGFRFDPGSRAQRIEDLLKELKEDDGKLDLADMRKIQYDHSDLMAVRYIGLVEKVLDQLTLSEMASEFAKELITWKNATQCRADKGEHETVAYLLWLKELVKEYYAWLKVDIDRTFANLSDSDRDQMFAGFIASPFAATTVYHRTLEGIDSNDEDTGKLLTLSLERAVSERSRRNLDGTRWGEAHQLQFTNLLEGLVPTLPHPTVERDGTWTTVDMAAFDIVHELLNVDFKPLSLPNVWGPNFRLAMVVEDGKPIEAYNVMPGGLSGNFANPGALSELLRFRDGKQRELIPFNE